MIKIRPVAFYSDVYFDITSFLILLCPFNSLSQCFHCFVVALEVVWRKVPSFCFVDCYICGLERPEAAPTKCAGRESAGVPALSHTWNAVFWFAIYENVPVDWQILYRHILWERPVVSSSESKFSKCPILSTKLNYELFKKPMPNRGRWQLTAEDKSQSKDVNTQPVY